MTCKLDRLTANNSLKILCVCTQRFYTEIRTFVHKGTVGTTEFCLHNGSYAAQIRSFECNKSLKIPSVHEQRFLYRN